MFLLWNFNSALEISAIDIKNKFFRNYITINTIVRKERLYFLFRYCYINALIL